MKKRTKTQLYYNAHPSPDLIRRAWAAVTRDPTAHTRALAVAAGLKASSFSSVAGALRILRDAGYIAYTKGTKGARTIVVPFVVVE